MPKDKIEDIDIFNNEDSNQKNIQKKRKVRKSKPLEDRLTCPVKVYFSEDDYKELERIAKEDGLSTAAFIRNRIKRIIRTADNQL